jgi:cellulose synthase (UDP-forming)
VGLRCLAVDAEHEALERMMWLLLLALAAVLAASALRLGRSSTFVRTGIVYLGHAALLSYLVWRIAETLPPPAWSLPVSLAYVLLGLELVAGYVVLTGIEFPSSYMTWPTSRPFITRTIDRSDEARAHLDWYGKAPPRICILIPCYNEPWEVLEKTFVGAVSQDYPNYEVWLLDDGRRPWLREKAEAHGIEYVTREDNRHHKAGNLNNALARLRSREPAVAFVALLDADFVARPEFSRKALALMHAEDVGIVQTPQVFYNPDPFQRVFGVRNWPEEQRWWFDVEEPALDVAGGALCCGTACVLRVAALDSIGGFPTESLTEDSLCSAKLKQRGWRTVYLGERLAVGLAAEGLHEWFTQRVRWLRGEMQNRAASGRPKNIYCLANYWLSFLSLSIYAARDLAWLLAHITFWFTGAWVLDTSVWAGASHFIPLWLVPIFWTWLSRGRRSYLVTSSQFKLQRFVWLSIPLLSAFFPSAQKFEVTPKAVVRHHTVVHWRALRWHALLGAALVVGIFYNVLDPTASARAHPWFWPNLLVSSYLVAEMLAAIAPAIEAPQRRRDDRYETRERIEVCCGGQRSDAVAKNISLGGVLLASPGGQTLPSSVTLAIADVGPVRACRVRQVDGTVAYRFESPELRPSLIRKLYCSEQYVPLPDGWRWAAGVGALLRWPFALAGTLFRRSNGGLGLAATATARAGEDAGGGS